MVQLLWKTVGRLLKKLNAELSFNPANLLLGIYPKELKIRTQNGICTSVSTAALFRIAKRQKTIQMLDG